MYFTAKYCIVTMDECVNECLRCTSENIFRHFNSCKRRFFHIIRVFLLMKDFPSRSSEISPLYIQHYPMHQSVLQLLLIHSISRFDELWMRYYSFGMSCHTDLSPGGYVNLTHEKPDRRIRISMFDGIKFAHYT